MTRSLGLTHRALVAVLFALIPGGGCSGLESTWPCSLLAGGHAGEQRGQWEAVHLDLCADLDVPSRALTGKGVLRLRLSNEPSYGPTLELTCPSHFANVRAPAGANVTIDSSARQARVRFAEPQEIGTELEVAFEFTSCGGSCPVVVSANCAYARCHGNWYPTPLAGSPSVPGTTRLTVPAGWQTLSNGSLVRSLVEGDQRVDTWEMTSPAARSFAAGPYHVERFSFDDRTIGVYTLASDKERASRWAAGLAGVLQALEARFGPYPYEMSSVVEIPEEVAAWKGASDNGFIMVASSVFKSDSVNVPLIAHELAHSWWGNYVRTRDPAALMVDEALAQYGVVLAIEAIEGKQAATDFLQFSRPGYIPCESACGYFNRLFGEKDDKALMNLTGEGQDYLLANSKGHWVYHMLRRRVGDGLFFDTLRRLVERYGGREMSLADLRAAFVQAAPSAASLETFFSQWLDRPGAPVFDVTWMAADGADGPAVRITIRQKGEPYELRLEVAVDADDASETHTVQLSDREQTFLLTARGQVTGVRIDPQHRLLVWNAVYEQERGP